MTKFLSSVPDGTGRHRGPYDQTADLDKVGGPSWRPALHRADGTTFRMPRDTFSADPDRTTRDGGWAA